VADPQHAHPHSNAAELWQAAHAADVWGGALLAVLLHWKAEADKGATAVLCFGWWVLVAAWRLCGCARLSD
jgi:hypothetical protein